MIKKIILFFEKNKNFSIIALIGVFILMWCFSSIPGSAIQAKSIWPSRIYHFSIFFAFTFCFIAVINNKKMNVKIFLITILVSLGIACLDEIHQYFVPMRSVDFGDILTDLTGVISSITIYTFFRNKKIK
jgi:VanZ family protein